MIVLKENNMHRRIFFIIFISSIFLLDADIAFAVGESLEARKTLVSKERPEHSDFILRTDKASSKALVSWENTRFDGFFFLRRKAFTNEAVGLDKKIFDIFSKEDISSLDKYAEWLDKNFEYKKDASGDIWTYPEEMLSRDFGDCEDFAFLNQAVLRLFGYEGKIEIVRQRYLSHAICVFEKDGEIMWFDNKALKKANLTSQRDLNQYLARSYGWKYLYDIESHPKYSNILSSSNN
ncbi:MAG: transglutaminase-like domain-containing protein [Candidatus Omnitrophota bacterium]